ncbi:6-carboxytetrahydropterin synthase [Flavobacteriaceae bacterium]|jgi:6-pyruvoyltetrahydropterin/6-carboxytetrahydropterin synthase|nr:6-carboxytetrahydropterin synthase [Flavobacteriaceae bacterium]MDA7710438.1 6-carboxytetrahydropterin synthase [Flavobacteriaceae bacterium]MDA8900009.1 6-carboxytetrahydropterin synthase [Flavobacteriaceae bacterium]MDB4307065.1 6-carboxytetrahydropterin synthase [Flavobacteriaceae bacterium]
MNNTIRITKEFKFETGHALYGYDGLCKNVHGHSYKLAVTIIGQPISEAKHVKLGMVMDFGDLKKIVEESIVNRFDHATVLNNNSPHKELADIMEQQGHKVLRVPYQPTSESMIIDFATRIKALLPAHLRLHHLILRETDTAYASWFADDNS